MMYYDVISIGEEHIIPFITEKYNLNGYRIFSLDSHEGGRNVIYICEKEHNQSFVARVSYYNDRSKEDYLAELEFVRYLYDNGASVSNVITNKDGNLVEEIKYENQSLFISMFEKAKGMQLSENNYRYREGAPLTEYFFNCGKTLGKIHELSKKYNPMHSRYEFADKFNMKYINQLLPQDLYLLKNKIAEVLDELNKLDKSKEVYGMIHFDYSDGNYHIDFENGNITVYDFDNCCRAWYMYDIAELWIHGEGWIMFEEDIEKRKQFMDDYLSEILRGYKTETNLNDEMVAKLPLFVQANRIENLVDAFEVEKNTGENYLDDEDWDTINKCLFEGII